MIQCDTILYDIIQDDSMRYVTVRYKTIECDDGIQDDWLNNISYYVIQCDMTRYDMMQYDTIW